MLSRLQNLDNATTIGVLTAAGVYLIYRNALPSIADIRDTPSHDADVEKARKMAIWESVVLIGAVFFIARDLNSYVISGASLIGIDWMYRHANATQMGTGKLDTNTESGSSISDAGSYPMPDYTVSG